MEKREVVSSGQSEVLIRSAAKNSTTYQERSEVVSAPQPKCECGHEATMHHPEGDCRAKITWDELCGCLKYRSSVDGGARPDPYRKRVGAVGCTCTPVTAAGVMVSDPHCPAHGTPRVKFTIGGVDGGARPDLKGEKEMDANEVGRLCPDCEDYKRNDPLYGKFSTCECDKPKSAKPCCECAGRDWPCSCSCHSGATDGGARPDHTTPAKIWKEGGKWFVHAVAFDIAAKGTTREEALKNMDTLLKVQISVGLRRGLTLRDVYFAAPPVYWNPPLEEIPIPYVFMSGATDGGARPGLLKTLDFPDIPFSFHDEPGEHDPCYVVMPGGCTLPLNHHATPGVDIARAKFIIDACNEKLARMKHVDPQELATAYRENAELAQQMVATDGGAREMEQVEICDALEKFGFAVQPAGLGPNGKRSFWYVGYTQVNEVGPDFDLMHPENATVGKDVTLLGAVRKAIELQRAAVDRRKR